MRKNSRDEVAVEAGGIPFTKDSNYIFIKVEGKEPDSTGIYSLFTS